MGPRAINKVIMLALTNVTALDLCLACVGVYLLKQVFNKKNPPYPPGPPGRPIIGNVLDVPYIRPWLTFTDWGNKYGDISHINVLGRHIVVVNSVKTAMDMLDNKSTIYSDRPTLPVGGELIGWKNVMVLLPYGDQLRRHCKNFHGVIGTRAAVAIYNQVVEVETHRFLMRLFAKPDQLQVHVRHTAGAVILRISHGYEVKENDDPFVDLADRVMAQWSHVTAPGAFLADVVPFLIKVPEWFPGADFKRLAREWHDDLEELVCAPHKFVVDQMAAGIAPESFTSNLLRSGSLAAEDEHIVKWSAAALYAGASDTVGPSLYISNNHLLRAAHFSQTVSTINAFFLAMTLFPDVQKKAQAEIDAVIGPDRLPSFADQDYLPYIGALVKETLRWHSVIPTGFAHCVSQDDIHDGYYIPKGSLIMTNIWFMMNDPKRYANPSQFNPERFLGKEPETDPRTICFGFGRRICPGIHLAEASVWLSAVMSLAVFDISKVVENGIEITPEVDPLSGTISHLKPFKCSIEPRSSRAVALIEQDVDY
ncbi:cytochrome P450 [Suillus fuscotomentosus]|uniref:Cytochrome P450 n=1 Tax=Suillus fuscotomentosus TaxID=1912939 RepID=A0AAD4EK41_9AGAM|nr:cytochrome P450 [Suillus fuscotomentosus]KAG1907516.1 cytochrome P450 [Suillus fuscotomentosus]